MLRRGYVHNMTETMITDTPGDIMEARDCIQLMLLEYGNVHIETLGQLLKLTNTAEREYEYICTRRCCRGRSQR